jgi:hypothetical protein
MAVISAVLSLDEHLSQINTSCVLTCCYQLVYCCLIQYFPVRTCIAKCFTNSSRWLWRKLMFENNHMFCFQIHHVRTCTICVTSVSSGLATRVTLNQVSWETLGSLLHGSRPDCDFTFVGHYVNVVVLHFKLYNLHKARHKMSRLATR